MRCTVKAEGRGAQQWVGSVVVVRAAGALDMLTAPDLRADIQAALTRQPTGLIVDLTDVEFLASAGMQVLISTHNLITPGVRFAVVADGPATSRPLKITGLTDIIALFPNLDDAVATIAE